MFNPFVNLLVQHRSLPIFADEPTYLELCRYPARRFEEIYSRLLKFFLDPSNAHRCGTLFLDALLGCIHDGKELEFDPKQVIVDDEINAGGKRIDLVIKSDKFVIGIENKINAELYNPLEVYSHRLNLDTALVCYKVVLSVKALDGQHDLTAMLQHGFVNVTYKQLFAQVTRRQQNLTDTHPTYSFILEDMIKTIDNMDTPQYRLNERRAFFLENKELIEELIEEYGQYTNSIRRTQATRISSIEEILNVKTNDKWWIWNGYDLGYTFYEQNRRLGIEAEFVEGRDDPFESFRFKISTWKISDWMHFEKRIRAAFPALNVTTSDDRANMEIGSCSGKTDDELATMLAEIYFEIKKALTYLQDVPVKNLLPSVKG